MKKLVLFAAVAGFGLCSATGPKPDEGPREARAGYPPCSRHVRDNCIQLRERGVRTPENLARNARTDLPQAHAAPVRTARAAPGASGGRYVRPHRQLSRRVRHAGERG